jgi:hypothetical protein
MKQSVWTSFMDMHSGGSIKIKENGKDIQYIYIEGERKTAEWYFTQLFERDPDHVSCVCCGSDYSVEEYPSLEKATAYARNCLTIKPINADPALGHQDPAYKTAEYKEHYYLEAGEEPPVGYMIDKSYSSSQPHQTVAEYSARPDVKVLTKKQICKLLNLVK